MAWRYLDMCSFRFYLAARVKIDKFCCMVSLWAKIVVQTDRALWRCYFSQSLILLKFDLTNLLHLKHIWVSCKLFILFLSNIYCPNIITGLIFVYAACSTVNYLYKTWQEDLCFFVLFVISMLLKNLFLLT